MSDLIDRVILLLFISSLVIYSLASCTAYAVRTELQKQCAAAGGTLIEYTCVDNKVTIPLQKNR